MENKFSKEFFREARQVILGILLVVWLALCMFAMYIMGFVFAFMMYLDSSASDENVLWVLPIIFCSIPFIYFIHWVVKDIKKIKSQGVNLKTRLWITGMILPSVIVVFPIYFFKRNITWKSGLGLKEYPHVELKRRKSKKALKIFGVLFLLMVFYGFMINLILQNRNSFKPLISFIVKHSLTNNCNGKRPCDEFRSLPKTLQNKKVVFGPDTEIQFDPYSSIDFSQFDILGIIDPKPKYFNSNKDFINPILGKYGYLQEREYKIIRSVYSYDCSNCINGSDLGYIVLEDSKGNRFTELLDDQDMSVTPWRDIPWDEQLPTFMWKDKSGKQVVNAKLIDVN